LPQWEYCDCQHKTIWFGVLFATKGLLLLFGVFLAWETRHVNIPALNDSRYVGMSVYNVVILSVVGVPAALMIEQAQNATFALTAFFIVFCTLCYERLAALAEGSSYNLLATYCSP